MLTPVAGCNTLRFIDDFLFSAVKRSVQSILGVLTTVVDVLAVNRIDDAVALNAVLYRSCGVLGDVKHYHYQSKHCIESSLFSQSR